MNDKFDELAKGLAQSVTRRGALKKFGVGVAGIALAALGWRTRRGLIPNRLGRTGAVAPMTNSAKRVSFVVETIISAPTTPAGIPGNVLLSDFWPIWRLKIIKIISTFRALFRTSFLCKRVNRKKAEEFYENHDRHFDSISCHNIYARTFRDGVLRLQRQRLRPVSLDYATEL